MDGPKLTGRPGLLAAAIVVGLGVGPLIGALGPWPAWAAGLGLLAVALVGVPVARAELAAARLSGEGGCRPEDVAAAVRDGLSALLSALLATLAAVQGAGAAAALLGLAANGSRTVSPAGLEELLGSAQGFLGTAGLQGSPLLLAGVAAVLLGAALVVASPFPLRWMAGLLVAFGAGAVLSAAQQPLWIATRLLDRQADWPSSPSEFAAWLGPAVLTGLLMCGAGAGALEAATVRFGAADRTRGAGWWQPLLPALGLLLGLVATAPAVATVAGAPLLAPAPMGRQAALVLAPAAALPGAGWQAAWFASLLAASLLGVLIAAQPARLVLERRVGLLPGAAAPALVALIAIGTLPSLLVSGVREDLLVAAAGLLILRALQSLLGSWPRRTAAWVVRALALAGLAAAAAALLLPDLPASTLPDGALLRHRVLSIGLLAALAAFWAALLLLSALRARRLRRPAPASPGGRRTRA